MNYNGAIEYIHSLQRFGSRPGLERVTALLEALGNPQDSLDVIHVAGTNGKGSTCVFLSSVLRCAGLKTGLYISPFVTQFGERIQINGVPISDGKLAEYAELAKTAADRLPEPITEFEFITALAFRYFADNRCDCVVLEVGLGGRLDATNVVKSPKASVITRIALDHTDILGDTEAKIAREKCGIIKPKCPVVTMSANSGEALDVIQTISAENNCRLTVSGVPEVTASSWNGSAFIYKNKPYEINLAGPHQTVNAAVAIDALAAAYPEIDDDVVRRGLSLARFPARCEVISKNPLVLLDGSHNPNGTAALSAVLESGGITGATAIVGFMADKDVEQALRNVAGKFSRIITVTVASNRRSMKAEALAALCARYCKDVTAAESYEQAILALGAGPAVIFGSLYLAGDIRPLLIKHFRTKTE